MSPQLPNPSASWLGRPELTAAGSGNLTGIVLGWFGHAWLRRTSTCKTKPLPNAVPLEVY